MDLDPSSLTFSSNDDELRRRLAAAAASAPVVSSAAPSGVAEPAPSSPAPAAVGTSAPQPVSAPVGPSVPVATAATDEPDEIDRQLMAAGLLPKRGSSPAPKPATIAGYENFDPTAGLNQPPEHYAAQARNAAAAAKPGSQSPSEASVATTTQTPAVSNATPKLPDTGVDNPPRSYTFGQDGSLRLDPGSAPLGLFHAADDGHITHAQAAQHMPDASRAQMALDQANQHAATNPGLAGQLKAFGGSILQGITSGIGTIVRSPLGQGVAAGIDLATGQWHNLTDEHDSLPEVQARNLGNRIEHSTDSLVAPELKDTIGAKVGGFIGGVVPFVGASLTPGAQVTVPALLFGQGYQHQYEEARDTLTKTAQQSGQPVNQGQIEVQAHTAGLLGGAINTVLALPAGRAAGAVTKVFGGTTRNAITQGVVDAFERDGSRGLLDALNRIKGQSGISPEVVDAVQQATAQINKTIGQRAIEIAKTAAKDSAIGGGVQVGQNIVAQQVYDPNRSTFEDVPAQALGFAAMGGLSSVVKQGLLGYRASEGRGIARGSDGAGGSGNRPAIGPEPDPVAGAKPVAGRVISQDTTNSQPPEPSVAPQDISDQRPTVTPLSVPRATSGEASLAPLPQRGVVPPSQPSAPVSFGANPSPGSTSTPASGQASPSEPQDDQLHDEALQGMVRARDAYQKLLDTNRVLPGAREATQGQVDLLSRQIEAARKAAPRPASLGEAARQAGDGTSPASAQGESGQSAPTLPGSDDAASAKDASGQEIPAKGEGQPDVSPGGEVERVAESGSQSGRQPTTYQNVVGDKLDAKRTAFATESGTLGIARSDMPQIAAEHRGAMANFLKGRNMEVSEADELPGSLRPSQGDFNPGKVRKAGAIRQAGDANPRRILTSSDGFVMDGHHQWLDRLQNEPDQPMPTLRINAPAKEILGQIHDFPSAGMAGKIPDIGEDNLAVGDQIDVSKNGKPLTVIEDRGEKVVVKGTGNNAKPHQLTRSYALANKVQPTRAKEASGGNPPASAPSKAIAPSPPPAAPAKAAPDGLAVGDTINARVGSELVPHTLTEDRGAHVILTAPDGTTRKIDRAMAKRRKVVAPNESAPAPAQEPTAPTAPVATRPRIEALPEQRDTPNETAARQWIADERQAGRQPTPGEVTKLHTVHYDRAKTLVAQQAAAEQLAAQQGRTPPAKSASDAPARDGLAVGDKIDVSGDGKPHTVKELRDAQAVLTSPGGKTLTVDRKLALARKVQEAPATSPTTPTSEAGKAAQRTVERLSAKRTASNGFLSDGDRAELTNAKTNLDRELNRQMLGTNPQPITPAGKRAQDASTRFQEANLAGAPLTRGDHAEWKSHLQTMERDFTLQRLAREPLPAKGAVDPDQARALAQMHIVQNTRLLRRLGVRDTAFGPTVFPSGIEFGDDRTLRIDPDKLARTVANVRDHQAQLARKGVKLPGTPENYVEQVLLAHEGLHGAQVAIAKEDGMSVAEHIMAALPDEAMPEGWEQTGREAYGDEWDELKPWQKRAEYTRMWAESEGSGTITEAFYKYMARVLAYFKRIATGAGIDPRVRAYVDRLLAKLDHAREGSSLKPIDPAEAETARREYEAGLRADAEEQTRAAGGVELIDALRKAGGLPVDDPAFRGELHTIRENSQPVGQANRAGTFNLFRKDAPGLDELTSRLREQGFAFETPDDLFNALHQRLTTQQPHYAFPATAEAQSGLSHTATGAGRVPRTDTQTGSLFGEDEPFELLGEQGSDAERVARARAEANRGREDTTVLPRLRGGERQGDLLANQPEDLTLVGERGVDHGARQEAAAQAERESAAAQAKQEGEQGNLFQASAPASAASEPLRQRFPSELFQGVAQEHTRRAELLRELFATGELSQSQETGLWSRGAKTARTARELVTPSMEKTLSERRAVLDADREQLRQSYRDHGQPVPENPLAEREADLSRREQALNRFQAPADEGRANDEGDAPAAPAAVPVALSSPRLVALERSLQAKEAELSRRIDAHLADTRAAHGQPLNDKRNGAATLGRWERQSGAIRRLQAGIDQTRRALDVEKDKLQASRSLPLPEPIRRMLEAGELRQWRRHPNTFFVRGVDRARLVYEPGLANLQTRYLNEIKPADYPAFRAAYNRLNRELADFRQAGATGGHSVGAPTPAPILGDDEEGTVDEPTPAPVTKGGSFIQRARAEIARLSDKSELANLLSRRHDAVDTLAYVEARHARSSVELDLPDKLDRQAARAVVEAGYDPARLRADLATVQGASNKKLAQRYALTYQHAIDHLDRLREATAGFRQTQLREAAAAEAAGLPPHAITRAKLVHDDPSHPERTVAPEAAYLGVKGAKISAAAAIAKGIDPGSLDLADAAESLVYRNQRSVNERAYQQQLASLKASDGKPLIGEVRENTSALNADGSVASTFKVPKGYVAVQAGDNVLVAHKEVSPILQAQYGQSLLGQHWLGKGALEVAALIKHGAIGIDTFHGFQTAIRSALGFQVADHRPGLAALDFADRDLARAVQAGKISQQAADSARRERERDRRFIAEGLQVGRATDNLLDAAGKANLIEQIPLWGTAARKTAHLIFHQLQPAYMLQATRTAFARNQKRFPSLSEEELIRKSVTQVNEFYGNLGSQGFFKSKTMQDAARLLFFAPGFTEGRLRTEARGFGEAARTVADGLRGKGWRMGVVSQAMAGVILASLVGVQALNLFTRGKTTWQNPEDGHRWDAWVPGGPHGQGFFFSPLSMAAEYSHELYKYLHEGGSVLDAAARIGSNKLSGLARGVKDLLTGRDWRGEPYATTGERLRAAALDVSPLPMQAGMLVEKDPKATLGFKASRPGSVLKQAAVSVGVKLDPAQSARSQMYQIAEQFRPAKAAGAHPVSAYADLRHALDNGDEAGVEAEVRRLLGTGKRLTQIEQAGGGIHGYTKEGAARVAPELFTGTHDGEKRMLAKLTPAQKAVYSQALADRKENAQMLAGVTKRLRMELMKRAGDE